MKRDLSAQFSKFAGKEVTVHETKRVVNGHEYVQARLDEADSTIVQFRKAAEDNGLRARIWLPNTVGTMDFRTDRLNARIEKGQDGKYRFGSKFTIG